MVTPMNTVTIEVIPRTSGELYRRRLRRRSYDFKVPAPKYRHATPSAPWPWIDFSDIGAANDLPQEPPDDTEWGRYPQNIFENWTNAQVKRSQILTGCSDCEESIVYKIGVFDDLKLLEKRIIRRDDICDLRKYWNDLGKSPPPNMRVQAFFVEDMTSPLLQILGTRYKVEPFFFASSVNWLPSRYQETPRELGDHITVVLPFIRILKVNELPITRTKPIKIPSVMSTRSNGLMDLMPSYREETQIINTQAALSLSENKILIQDLLSIHMVRETATSTIISYHPSLQAGSARRLQHLVYRTRDSIYWSNIFKRSKDSTFLLLAMLWYPLYAWDEAFEVLFLYMNALEHDVLKSNDIKLARELHRLQEHLLYYEQLLLDFLRSIEFVRDTPNPAMNDPSISEVERNDSAKLLHTEANTLISEVKRLNSQRQMMFDRVANAIHLTLATASLRESKDSQTLSEISVNDSSAIKRMAYLSMAFLPGTFLANVFSMNIREMVGPGNDPSQQPTETLAHYIEGVLCLTLLTSWLMVVLQKESTFHREGSSILQRTLWPLFYVYDTVLNLKNSRFAKPGR